VLRTPVALKLVYSTSRGARERLLKEVRLARQITHAAVCRVFDVGEADGQVFYSMEFVEGEDLAMLLRRAGRLPQERVLEIARRLCGGLAAAHAQGVLHRDLKPANVLVDEDGVVRITDFGIAIARTDGSNRTLIGTPGYMAPEQRIVGAPLTERTDVYAIGVILYELLVGEPPVTDPAAVASSPRPSALVPDVHPRLERVILKALAAAPDERWPSADVMAAALPSSLPAPARFRSLPWLAGAGLAATIAVLAALSSLYWPRAGSATLTDQDTIVLADFANTTGEPVFDGTLKVALAVALEQSPFLRVFPDDAMRETLRLMQRPPGERVTRSLARDVAARERFKAVVSGSIGSLGSNYVIALEAVNAETGDVMAREQVEASGKEQVLTSLGDATAKLRERLGESLPSIERFDAPLVRATTPSLEALQAYSLALDDGRVFMRVEAIPHLERALELDSDFALAHALLSGVYANTGQSEKAPPYAQRAYELRDRVSERERYFISWRYFVDAVQAWDRALDLASQWTASYPREAFAFNSLGLALASFGQHERAVPAFREAIRLDPKFVPPQRNLAGSLISLNRFDEARTLIAEAARQGISSIGIRQMSFALGLVAGDEQAMADAAARARTLEDQRWLLNSQARAAAFRGRVQQAHNLFQRAIQNAAQAGLTELAAGWTLEDAETHAMVGECAAARREAATGARLARDNFSIERAGRTLALCGDGAGASRQTAELEKRFPEATLTQRIHIPVIAAIGALGRGDPARARDLLAPVESYDDAPAAELWPAYLRARAHLQLKDGAAAASAFQKVVNARGEAPSSALHPLAHLGLARAKAVAGDVGGARAAYDAFLTLWREADQDLPVVAEARAERARLP